MARRLDGIGFGGEPRAPHAADPGLSRGRLVPEPESPTRTPFQRDRDRIIHSTAFRRLAHKTQVFLYHEGDHFRTRLTHTIEVAQIARALARALRLDEDLAEALALGHDLGHTPFGHAGERALARAMAGFGGFDHNAQTLRIVTSLERRYAGFDGLNLSWETLEGLVKHNGPLTDREGRPLGRRDAEGHAVAAELPYAIRVYQERHDLGLWSRPGAEAQAAALADDIAYDAHDIDDGLRAGLIVPDQLEGVPLAGEILRDVRSRHPGLDLGRLIQEVTRRLITRMVEGVIGESLARIDRLAPASSDAVRALDVDLVAFPAEIVEADRGIKAFLYRHVYRSASVMGVMRDAEAVVEDLFSAYMHRPDAMPAEWGEGLEGCGPERRARRVADYIAGMTDRFALIEHRRLFDATPELR
ncbi:deoxyguanosinetriphosphate triphosphohydrolase [Prosthecomicrobium sp. N25]|uniref:deoxyguanosinetriphosphate triphosphohydrolase n=1 Tax=Prosthecomicrobium sp. N25 TaxID=3129254 RepID=UPI00307714B1